MLANILIGLVALIHIYFLFLEMIFWTKPLGLKVFNQSRVKAEESKVLAANQGLYNGFLSAGLIWGLLQGQPEFALQIKLFFLVCIIVAGVYGAYSVNRRIFFIQALPAILAAALLLFSLPL
jgi:putative membrane protein